MAAEGQILIQHQPGHGAAVGICRMIVVIGNIRKRLVQQHDDIFAIWGMDDSSIIAAGVHESLISHHILNGKGENQLYQRFVFPVLGIIESGLSVIIHCLGIDIAVIKQNLQSLLSFVAGG